MSGPIICGVDDSESAKGAARVARVLSGQLRLRLLFVRVVAAGASEARISAVAARLRQLADNATEVDCGARWMVAVGHPADRLLAVAQKEAANFIVVGSTGPRSSLLGSISADVSRRAPCPVVVVAPGADRSTANGNGASARFDTERDATNGARAGRQPRDFAGGIVRFSIGGGKV